MKIGLVLEGGGMRGLYTNGVLDCLMDNGFWADYVIGVSAGACSGVSYVSGQRGRSRRINLGYLEDKRYLSLESLLKTGSMFGMEFLFEEIPNRLDPFDYDAFLASPIEFVAGVTDLETGRPAYFSKQAMDHTSIVLRASSAIPVFSPAVEIAGRSYLDGGTSDPIPVRKALEDGCDRVVVVRTRDRSYQKSPEKLRAAYRRVFREHPAMIEALDRRHEVYNETLDFLRTLERQGVAQVIAPEHPVQISRFEKDRIKLNALYKNGMLDAQKFLARNGWERKKDLKGEKRMRWLVVGAGGTGGCIGGYLAAAGEDVTLIARGAHLAAIREHGLTLRGSRMGDLMGLQVRACTAEEYSGTADVIFVCVKGYSIDGILPLLEKAAGPQTIVIPVLNIVGTGARLAEKLPRTTVLDGCIYIVAHIFQPGGVVQQGETFRIVCGEREGDVHAARLAEIARALADARIDMTVSDNIRRDAFRKYLLISPMAAAGAYYGKPMGVFQQPGEERALFQTLVEELYAIAQAQGFDYGAFDIVGDQMRRLDNLAPDITASMQKDLDRGGESELDGLVFEPVRLGRRFGVPTPGYCKVAEKFGFSG